MTRKRSKSKGATLDQLDSHLGKASAEAPAEDAGVSPLDSLPTETLLLIFAKLQFPSRQYASLACRRWHELLQDPQFCRHLAPGQSLSEALLACNPGDTLICPPGMFQETLLVDKPVRLVAEDHWRAETRQRRQRRQGRRPADLQGRDPQPSPLGAARAGPASARPLDPPYQQPQHAEFLRLRAGGWSGRAYGGGGGDGAQSARPPMLSVSVLSLRPPVVVMDSRCCFVGFEFHTSVVHNEVSICSFGPNSSLARFEHCTFSGLTGLRVPYSKGSQTRLELYDCTLLGTSQSLAAVQMDAGQLLMVRCALQNNSVGVEVGPEALARLLDCEVRWCGSALVVDGCLAMAYCRLWGNSKVGNVSTDARLRAALIHSEACLASGEQQQYPPPAAPAQQHRDQQQEKQLAPSGSPLAPAEVEHRAVNPAAAAAAAVQAPAAGRRRRGRRGAAADPPGGAQASDRGAATTAGTAAADPGGSSNSAVRAPAAGGAAEGTAEPPTAVRNCSSPERVTALAAAQWGEVLQAFGEQRQLVRVVSCDVAAAQLVMRAGLHKEVRKKARELVRQVYGAPDDDLFPEWEVLVHSDLDSDLDDDDSSVTSGSAMADDDDLDLDDDEDPLDAADNPDLDESGESHSGSSSSDSDSSDSDSGSESGSGSEPGDGADSPTGMEHDGPGGGALEVDAGMGEDEEWGGGDLMSSGGSGSGSSSDSSESDSSDSDSSGSDTDGSSG